MDAGGERGGRTAAAAGSDDQEVGSRGHWRPSEDETLRRLVGEYGPQNWNFIAEKLPGRSGLRETLHRLISIYLSPFLYMSRSHSLSLDIQIHTHAMPPLPPMDFRLERRGAN